MSETFKNNRRSFIKGAALASISAPLATSALAAPVKSTIQAESFFGLHQPGIATPQQQHTYFIAMDVTSSDRSDLIQLLKAWTQASAEMMAQDKNQLTLTVGFGPSLFEKEGVDRFGIAHHKPEALVDLPRFAGDQLIAEKTGGDLSIQACANDPLVVESAVRRLVKLASGVAVMRWAQMGFMGNAQPHTTPRNQMGFKDGTINVQTKDAKTMRDFVWVGEEGPQWLRGGSYMVIRPIRIALEHWDEMNLAFQEETVGRHKATGAPIGKRREFEPLGLDREDKDGNPIVNENSHAALSAPENNGGAQILRRAFSYDNGVVKVAERWPPWRQMVTFDAGLLFQCYQRDPRLGFIRIFAKMAQIDMLNQFTTHVGSGLFACPPGAKAGQYIGSDLFE